MNPYEVDPDEEMFLRQGGASSSASDEDETDEQPLHCSFSQILKGGDVFFSDVLSEPMEFANSTNNAGTSLYSSSFARVGNTSSGNGAGLQQQHQSTAQAFSNLINSVNLMDSYLESVGLTSTLYPGVEDEEFPTINTKSMQMTF